MAEYVRSIKARIEVDTNKQTYVLEIDDGDGDVVGLIRDFLDGIAK